METSCMAESERYEEKKMLYLVQESFNEFPQQVVFYRDLESKGNSRNFEPVNVPKNLYLHGIEKLTLLKTR